MSAIYTFPAEKSFIDLLAAYVLRQPPVTGMLVLLPTRRSCIALREACLRMSSGAALLLPRIQPLGDVEEEALFAESWLESELGEPLAQLKPAIPRMHREIVLARLIVEQAEALGVPADMEQATLLARELARLMDSVEREELSFAQLPALAPEALAGHWQLTLSVLSIISERWPRLLEREGYMNPVARRNALLRALAAQWERSPPAYGVIAAGSTGSLPATAALLKAVASLPGGRVILPGLDGDSPADIWDKIEESHPQFGMKQLLERLDIDRGQVRLWDDPRIPPSCPPQRMALWRAALQPASTVQDWAEPSGIKDNAVTGLKDMHRLEVETPQEEARVIALLLREVLETPEKTAAVVTQDRALARRVAAEMQALGIAIDDSAGGRLLSLEQGVFLQLVAEEALSQAAPVALLSVLKHPLAACGMTPAECRAAARMLERLALRGVRPAEGFASLRHAAAGQAEAAVLLAALEKSMAEFSSALRQGRLPFARLLALHLAAAERLAETPEEEGARRLWSGDGGRALAEALAALRGHAEAVGTIEAGHYPALFVTLLSGEVYRRAYGLHPRLHILSPMEARLQQYDRVILAGLNEGAWPPALHVSPWMSRPMQRQFGLAAPERAVGMSAHDFYMLCAARELVLSRSRRQEGAQAAASRFLLRLDTLLHAHEGKPYAWPALPHVGWMCALQRSQPKPCLPRPAPTPPLTARPRQLSVTDIERWLRDPYMIYARHVLRLKPLDPIDQEPGGRELGTVIHDALRRFAGHGRGASLETLLECGRQAFAVFAARPGVRAFWWPRFEAIAAWIIEQERRRPPIQHQYAECSGEISWEAPGGPFTLRTRLDRIELHPDGGATIIDYKTGGVPKIPEIRAHLAPQLPLEAYILCEGQVQGVAHAPSRIADLCYWKLAGGANEAVCLSEKAEVAALIAAAREKVQELVAAFDDENTAYLAVPDAALMPRFNDYAHLERQAEWEMEG
ncbi:MAG: double-strand break repair protein AddB [Alphaproteobacteria bacterium]|nr:double-strand break repair protein AddB [Alphaproteobacteria bacterium]